MDTIPNKKVEHVDYIQKAKPYCSLVFIGDETSPVNLQIRQKYSEIIILIAQSLIKQDEDEARLALNEAQARLDFIKANSLDLNDFSNLGEKLKKFPSPQRGRKTGGTAFTQPGQSLPEFTGVK